MFHFRQILCLVTFYLRVFLSQRKLVFLIPGKLSFLISEKVNFISYSVKDSALRLYHD